MKAADDAFRSYRTLQQAVHARLSGPPIVEIEPTTRCRASCTFCPRRALSRPRGDLPLRDAERIAEGLADRELLGVLLSGFGEPTLHPDLPGLVSAIAARIPHPVGIVTNGERLTPDLAERLLEAGATFFHVSVPAATYETARRVAPGLNVVLAERNLCDLLTVSAGRCPVAINFTVTEKNRAEKARVCRTWRSRGAEAVYCAPEHNRGGFLRPPRQEKLRSECWIYTHAVFVDWEGRVLVCCHDLTGRIDFGSLQEENLVQILRRKADRLDHTLASSRCRRCDFPLADQPAPAARRGRARVEAEQGIR